MPRRCIPLWFRLIAALLLATIGLQAVPAAADMESVRSGSAFSMGTVDVAILNMRREEARPQLVPVPDPVLPPRIVERGLATRPVSDRPAPPMSWTNDRLWGDVGHTQARPRAPPLS